VKTDQITQYAQRGGIARSEEIKTFHGPNPKEILFKVPKLEISSDNSYTFNEDDIISERGSDGVRMPYDVNPKTFANIPREWHQTLKVRNPKTQRIKLFFKCRFNDCGSLFKKSCNLRDHFRKHTGQRPF
jgi:hypothetical protein